MFILKESLPDLNGKIRFLHAVPGAPSVDIYADGTLLASNCKFGELTDYIELASSNYSIEIYKAGTYDTALFNSQLDVIPGTSNTISIAKNNNSLMLFSLKDAGAKAGQDICFLRFIHISPNSPLVTLSLRNGETLFNSVEYLETTGYYPLSPGIYDFKLSLLGASALNKTISNISLEAGQFQTIYLIGLLNSEPQLGFLLSKDGRQT